MQSGTFIEGSWSHGRGSVFETINPASGEVITALRSSTAEDVDLAVKAAAAAFESQEWGKLPAVERGLLLMRLADLLERDAEELARLETTDQGQTIAVSRGFTVKHSIDVLRYYAGWADKITGVTAPVSPAGVQCRNYRAPIGVCGLITAWNFPLVVGIWKIAPALACGNTVVIKPPELAPLSTLKLAELVVEAGFPSGVLNVVSGGPDVGKSLIEHPQVAKISFTGSTSTGRDVASRAGNSLKRLSLQLGNKGPCIVAPDGNIDAAVQGSLAGGLFFNSGQACAALSRFYVQRDQVDEFSEKLAKFAASATVGPGLADTTLVGPLMSEAHLDRVHRYVQQGIAEGADLLTGGNRVSGSLANGYFYQPTVFANVHQNMTIARDEIFGPVLSVIAYDHEDDLGRLANDSEYGLSASVWSSSVRSADRIARSVKAGTVWVNMSPSADPAAAWGGVKASGVGRELGGEAIDSYTEVRSIWTNEL